MNIEVLIEILQNKIRNHESNAEEYVQELDNPEQCDIELAKASALQEIVDLLLTEQIETGLGF